VVDKKPFGMVVDKKWFVVENKRCLLIDGVLMKGAARVAV
jgi:hypothetical protein